MSRQENSGCLFALFDLFNFGKKPKTDSSDSIDKTEQPSEPLYKRKYLLTKNELYFYKELKKVADKLNLSVLAKIRMADLVEPRSNGKRFYQEFAKIKAKHIDFALCNPENMFIVLLIELDDGSHENGKTAKRDSFVEKVYSMTGYKLYRTRGTANLENGIRNALAE